MMVVIVEAEHMWNESPQPGMGPANPQAWQRVQHPKMIGHVLQAPPDDHVLMFRHYRKAREIEDPPGLLGLGANARLGIGHYKVTWWLAGTPMHAAPGDVVATLSVEVKGQRLVAHDVTAAELAHAHGGRFGVPLRLDLDHFEAHADFVTRFAGRGEVAFLRTECERAG